MAQVAVALCTCKLIVKFLQS